MSLGVGIEAPAHLPAADMSGGTVPMVNPILTQTVLNPNVKDSRWLTLEVCREFTRNKCTRTDTECKFAHPPPHVEVQNGRVTCCFDSIKGKCQRKDPPCKYLHPPQHLREQLLQNGRNNLIIKQFQAQAITNQLMMPGVYPNMAPHNLLQYNYPATSPFIPPMPGMVTQLDTAAAAAAAASVPQVSAPVSMPGVSVTNSGAPAQSQKLQQQRNDRLDASAVNGNPVSDSSYTNGTTGVDALAPSSQYPLYLQNMNGMAGVVPMGIKHRAMDKSGVPVYQPTHASASYQPLVQFSQQPFVPVTQQTLHQYYRGDQTSPYSPVGPPATLPRF